MKPIYDTCNLNRKLGHIVMNRWREPGAEQEPDVFWWAGKEIHEPGWWYWIYPPHGENYVVVPEKAIRALPVEADQPESSSAAGSQVRGMR